MAQPTEESTGNRLIWFLGLLLLMFLFGCFDMVNGDIWWHLRTGQLIWERGEVPRTDWFTYTNPQAEWIDLHWLFQLAMAGLWSVGESAAVILTKCTAGTATIGICLTIGTRRLPAWAVVACWMAPVVILANRYLVRPEMVSLFLLAATMSVLYHSQAKPRLLWLLPAIQLVWVNVQGLFILQFVILACYLIGNALRHGLQRLGINSVVNASPPLRQVAPVVLCTIGASLINPYFLKGVLFPFVLLERVRGPEREFFHQFSSELRGLDARFAEHGLAGLTSNLPGMMLVLLFLGVLTTFVLLTANRRISAYRLLLFVAFSYLTWKMARNSTLFAVVSGVVLRCNIEDLVALGDSKTSKVAARGATAVPISRSKILAAIVAGCLGLLILSLPTGLFHQIYPSEPPRQFGLGQAPWYGHAACRFLAQPGMPRNVYAVHEGQAAVCIFHLCPEKRVFADARLELNTQDTLERYLQIQNQLAAGDPTAETNLRQGSDDNSELPALVFDNLTLLNASMKSPRLLQQLIGGNRWRCVFANPTHEQSLENSATLITGSTVFLASEKADKLGLPPVDLSRLTALSDTMRAAAEAERLAAR